MKATPYRVMASAITLVLGFGSAGNANAGEVFGPNNQASVFIPGSDFQPIFAATCELDYQVFLYYASNCGGVYYANMELPEGALIGNWRVSYQDNSTNNLTVSLNRNFAPVATSTTGVGSTTLDSFTSSASTTDYRFDIQSYSHTYDTYDHTSNTQYTYFVRAQMPADAQVRLRGVWVFYKRQIAPAPASATFSDVPTSHPFFNEVQQLVKSGITLGCGGGNYCPDATVTRGQMAAFLSRALGLHWDFNTNAP